MQILLLVLHVSGGTIGILSGTVAMIASKGGRVHRAAGNLFTIAMLTLATSGLCLAILKSQRGNIVASIVTFYLIGTAWLAGRRRDSITWIDWTAFLAGLAGAAAAITLSIYNLHNPAGADKSAPAGMGLVFGAILILAVSGDIRMFLRGGIFGRQRTTRHLWRMCFGLFIATGSFFLGQQKVFPAFLRGSMFLTVPALLPLPLLIYWLLRVRLSKAYKKAQPPSNLAPMVS
jgi:hypothetical protein